MTTLRERFDEFFTTEIFMRLSQKVKYATAQEEVRAFFRQELLALAETIEIFHDTKEQEEAENNGYNSAINDTVTLIRAKANELI